MVDKILQTLASNTVFSVFDIKNPKTNGYLYYTYYENVEVCCWSRDVDTELFGRPSPAHATGQSFTGAFHWIALVCVALDSINTNLQFSMDVINKLLVEYPMVLTSQATHPLIRRWVDGDIDIDIDKEKQIRSVLIRTCEFTGTRKIWVAPIGWELLPMRDFILERMPTPSTLKDTKKYYAYAQDNVSDINQSLYWHAILGAEPPRTKMNDMLSAVRKWTSIITNEGELYARIEGPFSVVVVRGIKAHVLETDPWNRTKEERILDQSRIEAEERMKIYAACCWLILFARHCYEGLYPGELERAKDALDVAMEYAPLSLASDETIPLVSKIDTGMYRNASFAAVRMYDCSSLRASWPPGWRLLPTKKSGYYEIVPDKSALELLPNVLT